MSRFVIDNKVGVGLIFTVLVQIGMLIWGASQLYHNVQYMDERISDFETEIADYRKETLRYINGLNDRISYLENQQKELIFNLEELKQEIK